MNLELSGEINKLRTQLIEKEVELNKLRNQYSELLIRYDALRTLTSITYTPVDDDEVQKTAVSQVLGMGKVFHEN